MSKKIFTLVTLSFILFLSFTSFRGMGQATVQTDKADYVPGEFVIITGTGWQPGEAVTLHFDEIPKPASCLLSHDLTAFADENGNIANGEFLIKENHRGVYFNLTATGLSSTFTAYNWFTDATISSTGVGGFWDLGATWSGGIVPAAGDAVVIAAGANVTIRTNVACSTLIISNSTADGITTSLTINSLQNLNVNSGSGLVTIGSATPMGNGNVSATSLTVNGNLISGNINQSPATRGNGSGGRGNTELTINSTGNVTATGNVSGLNTTTGANSLNGTASVIFTGAGKNDRSSSI